MVPVSVNASESWDELCYELGYDAGQFRPFLQEDYDLRGDEADGDKEYYDGFIAGCIDANNTRLVCEQATISIG